MKRVELILNQSVELDLLELFREKGVGKMYTKIPSAFGRGCTSPKMGDSVWPQVNCVYVVYCEEAEAAVLVEIAETLRKEYPSDGIAVFVL